MPKLLLIEDDPLMIRLYKTLFTTKGFQVFSADNGIDGLDVLREEKPDIVLLDVMMPKMDGLQTIKAIREDPEFKELPVIMLSNLGVNNVISEAFNYGATQYFVKSSVENNELVEAVNTLLNKEKKPQA